MNYLREQHYILSIGITKHFENSVCLNLEYWLIFKIILEQLSQFMIIKSKRKLGIVYYASINAEFVYSEIGIHIYQHI